MRNVTVYSTNTQTKNIVQSSATTWGDLREELVNNGVRVEGMKAIVGQTQVTLESAEAQLLETDFILFLSPTKVKNGYDYDYDYEDEEANEESCEDEVVNETPNQRVIALLQEAITILGGTNSVNGGDSELNDMFANIQANLED